MSLLYPFYPATATSPPLADSGLGLWVSAVAGRIAGRSLTGQYFTGSEFSGFSDISFRNCPQSVSNRGFEVSPERSQDEPFSERDGTLEMSYVHFGHQDLGDLDFERSRIDSAISRNGHEDGQKQGINSPNPHPIPRSGRVRIIPVPQ